MEKTDLFEMAQAELREIMPLIKKGKFKEAVENYVKVIELPVGSLKLTVKNYLKTHEDQTVSAFLKYLNSLNRKNIKFIRCSELAKMKYSPEILDELINRKCLDIYKFFRKNKDEITKEDVRKVLKSSTPHAIILSLQYVRSKYDPDELLDTVIKKDKTGEWIYLVGKNCKNLDYEKALDALNKKDKRYYELALKEWPKGAKETKEMIDKLKQKSQKMPTKKLKLKEWLNEEKDLSSMSAKEIYNAGIYWKNFDYEKGLEELIKKDKTGELIYWAGIDWKKFDYKKGLDALIEKDKSGSWICGAGKEWPEFDYEKAFDTLINKSGIWIYLAGKEWKQFDYKKGFQTLLKKDKHYYELALKEWPKGVKQTKKMINKLKRKSKKLPTKKLKLESLLEELLLEFVRKRNGKYYIHSHKDPSKIIGKKNGYSSLRGAVRGLLILTSRGGFVNLSKEEQNRRIENYIKNRHLS